MMVQGSKGGCSLLRHESALPLVAKLQARLGDDKLDLLDPFRMVFFLNLP